MIKLCTRKPTFYWLTTQRLPDASSGNMRASQALGADPTEAAPCHDGKPNFRQPHPPIKRRYPPPYDSP